MSHPRADAHAPVSDPPSGALVETAPAPDERPPLLGRRAVFLAAVGATAGAALVAAPAARAVAAPAEQATPAPAAPAAGTAAAAAETPAATVVVGDTSRVYYPEQYGFVASDADHTAAMSAFFAALMRTGGTGILPPGEIRVTSTGIDYSGAQWPKQALSGAPYGFPAIEVHGYGRRVTTIRQIAGATGDILTVQGKLGADAGPAANNKATVTLSGFSLVGTRTGRHGLYLRSLLHSRITDLEPQRHGCRGRLLRAAELHRRERRVLVRERHRGPPRHYRGHLGRRLRRRERDRHRHARHRDRELRRGRHPHGAHELALRQHPHHRLRGGREGGPRLRGHRHDQRVVDDLEPRHRRDPPRGQLGPGRLPDGDRRGRGRHDPRLQHRHRRRRGAHGIGVGLTNTGTRLAMDTLVGRGTMFMTPTKYPKQKVVVVGPDGRDTRVEKPSTPNNPDAKYDAVVSNSGLRSVDHFGRALPKVAFIA
ncbi:hypothetical protein [Clavibacter tessellarius]|uniref:hypothetical protein n=1 Tax=Clavibacter tessellarius TaxID=31965 RepID=UPI00324DECF3